MERRRSSIKESIVQRGYQKLDWVVIKVDLPPVLIFFDHLPIVALFHWFDLHKNNEVDSVTPPKELLLKKCSWTTNELFHSFMTK